MKPEIKQKAKALLKSANLRQTQPRLAILSALLNSHKPQTADQIIAKLNPACPNKVTIYRALESFVKAGLVHKAFIQQRKRHYELAHNCTEKLCHPHFTCTSCGLTQCLINIPTSIIKGMKKGFIIHRQQIRLEGLCPQCS